MSYLLNTYAQFQIARPWCSSHAMVDAMRNHFEINDLRAGRVKRNLPF
jgi:hypothetical protein